MHRDLQCLMLWLEQAGLYELRTKGYLSTDDPKALLKDLGSRQSENKRALRFP